MNKLILLGIFAILMIVGVSGAVLITTDAKKETADTILESKLETLKTEYKDTSFTLSDITKVGECYYVYSELAGMQEKVQVACNLNELHIYKTDQQCVDDLKLEKAAQQNQFRYNLKYNEILQSVQQWIYTPTTFEPNISLTEKDYEYTIIEPETNQTVVLLDYERMQKDYDALYNQQYTEWKATQDANEITQREIYFQDLLLNIALVNSTKDDIQDYEIDLSQCTYIAGTYTLEELAKVKTAQVWSQVIDFQTAQKLKKLEEQQIIIVENKTIELDPTKKTDEEIKTK